MRRRENIIKWLMAGDPAIRWQVLRGLVHATDDEVLAERVRVAREGWGAAILDLQQPNGQFGADRDWGWMNTIRTLTLLRELGVLPTDERVQGAVERAGTLRFEEHGERLFFEGEVEACLNGRILGIGAYFGVPSERLAAQLVGEQLTDGGWNCDAPPSVRSSVHSTICVLEGMAAYERAVAGSDDVRGARLKGEAYLLDRRLMYRRGTEELIDKRILRFGFPSGYEYDALRALDHFRDVGAEPDPRMADAIEAVRKRMHQNGLWPLNRIGRDPGALVPEPDVGAPSRWNTLRAMRVLDWWAAAR
ncbi:MAG: squalene cyclase [Hyphomicrobiaceae bacterium]|nr:squalene cyclase [Hyphomicrobiaceae bacterium]MCC0024919.1 hypothetical protein [Hyphomicrobiaceae bacterium]